MDECANEINQISDANVQLDDQVINVFKYRIKSGCFKVKILTDSCIDLTPGNTRFASDGYWLFIEFLSRGNHVLSSFGSCLSGRIKIGCTLYIRTT